MSMRDAWHEQAERWIQWARAPGHDSYWQFHRDAFLPLVPAPADLTVDIGCGEGRLSRDLRALGHHVVSVDASTKMATAARAKDGGAAAVADAARLPIKTATADCAIAFMSLQDIDDMPGALTEAARILRSHGQLVMAVSHPISSAGTFVGKHGDESRRFVIDGSWFERRRITTDVERDGYGMRFDSEHRPLQDYTDALTTAGFLIETLREVRDPDPGDKWNRIPLFLHIRAVIRRPA
jgi:SAM-dependent methyltransferase